MTESNIPRRSSNLSQLVESLHVRDYNDRNSGIVNRITNILSKSRYKINRVKNRLDDNFNVDVVIGQIYINFNVEMCYMSKFIPRDMICVYDIQITIHNTNINCNYKSVGYFDDMCEIVESLAKACESIVTHGYEDFTRMAEYGIAIGKVIESINESKYFRFTSFTLGIYTINDDDDDDDDLN